jgi:hypothetical protein
LAVEGRVDQSSTVLNEAMMDESTGTRKSIEGIKVDRSCNGFDNTIWRVSGSCHDMSNSVLNEAADIMMKVNSFDHESLKEIGQKID